MLNSNNKAATKAPHATARQLARLFGMVEYNNKKASRANHNKVLMKNKMTNPLSTATLMHHLKMVKNQQTVGNVMLTVKKVMKHHKTAPIVVVVKVMKNHNKTVKNHKTVLAKSNAIVLNVQQAVKQKKKHNLMMMLAPVMVKNHKKMVMVKNHKMVHNHPA